MYFIYKRHKPTDYIYKISIMNVKLSNAKFTFQLITDNHFYDRLTCTCLCCLDRWINVNIKTRNCAVKFRMLFILYFIQYYIE